MTSLTLSHQVFLLLGCVAAVITALYQRARAKELETQLASCCRALLNAPLKYMSWQPKAPHCGGLWCILHLPPNAKIPLIATVEVRDNVTSEGVRTMLHGAEILLTLGPLPRLSEQMPECGRPLDTAPPEKEEETRRLGDREGQKKP